MDMKTATSTKTRSSRRAKAKSAAGAGAEFAARFAQAWQRPSPEALVELLQPNVVLRQPHQPPIRGRDAALAEFRKLLEWLPRFHGEEFKSIADGDQVVIEWVMTVPLPGRAVRIPAVDRFTLRDGLAAERTVYFDQMKLVSAVLSRPSLWRGYVKYRWGV